MLHTHSFTYYHPRYIMFLSQYFSFPLSVPFHQCSILLYMSIPALSEGQAGEVFTYRGSLQRKVFHCFNQALRTLKRCRSHNHKRTCVYFYRFHFPYFDKHRLAGHTVDTVSRAHTQTHTHTHTHTQTAQIMRACLPSVSCLALPTVHRARPGQCKNMLISARAMREVALSGVGRVAARAWRGGDKEPPPLSRWVVAILFQPNLLYPLFFDNAKTFTHVDFTVWGDTMTPCVLCRVSGVTFRAYVIIRLQVD